MRPGFVRECASASMLAFPEMNQYVLVTHWHLDAPIERVWDAIVRVEDWPRWWKFVKRVVEIEPGGENGVGSLRRYTWTSRLPYELSFEMRTTSARKPVFLEGVAKGELDGRGRWDLAAESATTHVRYEWSVNTGKAWMNWLAPILAPAFRWNHGQVMAEGGRGLARHLGVKLLGTGAA
jgi:uncharacterized protein YndB with AHSA1/START domain